MVERSSGGRRFAGAVEVGIGAERNGVEDGGCSGVLELKEAVLEMGGGEVNGEWWWIVGVALQ